MHDLKGLQQVAMKMQKQFKTDKYFFWVVVALYMQKELQLYIKILLALGKREEAINVVKGELSAVCKVDFERKRIHIELLNPKEDWESLKRLVSDMLELKYFLNLPL
ncbi:hypothetical protein HDU96_006720 [Phlyctochytrium bullatum]|nr:hypothetical protein HDU96_006720 [Phlyctochytrium bullatum]